MQDVIGEYLGPAVHGPRPLRRSRPSCTRWERELWTVGNQGARAGLEMALWDLQGKALGRPLCDLIGGRTRDGLAEVVALGWDEPETLADKTRAHARRGRHACSRSRSVTPRSATRRASRPSAKRPDRSARITVDANQGWWDATTALRAIRLLEPYGIEFVEQPVRMDDLEAAR